MSTIDPVALWQRLREAGLVEGEVPVDDANPSPWFVRTMLGFAGWIGAAFLLGFVALGLDVDEASSMLFVGVIACSAAGGLLALRTNGDFASQFGFALSLAGQGLVLFGLFDAFGHRAVTAALPMGLFEAVLFFAVPSFAHRVWCAWWGAIAFAWVLVDAQLTAFGPALAAAACGAAWLAEFHSARRAALMRAAGYGLSLALVCLIALASARTGNGFPASWAMVPVVDRVAAGVIGGVALLWACHALTRQPPTSATPARGTLLALAAIAAVASLRAPGLAPAVLLVVLGFGHANRVLLGLGVATVLGYLSAFYYSLEATLLVKSAWLAATGAALLVARAVLFRRWPAPAPVEARDA